MEKTSSQNPLLIPMIVGFLVIGAGSFYGGMTYAKKTASPMNEMRMGQMGQMGQMRTMNGNAPGGTTGARGGMMGGMTSGEIISKDDTSVTVKLTDGGSKVVFLSTSTTIGTMSTGSLEDLSTGTNVMVVGSTNADGSVTASTIQIRPTGEMPMMAPRQ